MAQTCLWIGELFYPLLSSLYSVEQFKCKDGSQRIPLSKVNDDYCDCLDGSDEPGTSACSNGKFFCQNKGHKVAPRDICKMILQLYITLIRLSLVLQSKFIAASRVNDYICGIYKNSQGIFC